MSLTDQATDRYGFLAVLTHPCQPLNSDTSTHLPLSLAEFHDWYESEHIPLRLNHLDEFLCGVRYKSVGFSSPPREAVVEVEHNRPDWLALYLLTSPAVFNSPSYTSLREKRSEREKDVMKRIEVLVRVTGQVVDVFYTNKDKVEDEWTGFEPGKPSPWVLTHELSSEGDERASHALASWSSGSSNSNQGLLRTHLIKVLETGVSRFGLSVADPNQDPDGLHGNYWVVHEFATRECAEAFANEHLGPATSTLWEIYKSYPCIAQGNVKAV